MTAVTDNPEVDAILIHGHWRRLPEDVHIRVADLEREVLRIETGNGVLFVRTAAIGAYVVDL